MKDKIIDNNQIMKVSTSMKSLPKKNRTCFLGSVSDGLFPASEERQLGKHGCMILESPCN